MVFSLGDATGCCFRSIGTLLPRGYIHLWQAGKPPGESAPNYRQTEKPCGDGPGARHLKQVLLQYQVQGAANEEGQRDHDSHRFDQIPDAEFPEQHHEGCHAGEIHGQGDTGDHELFHRQVEGE